MKKDLSVTKGLFTFRDSFNIRDTDRLCDNDFIVLLFDLISEQIVQELHSQGLKVLVYTINDKYAADLLRKIHIDGIFSDYPDIV